MNVGVQMPHISSLSLRTGESSNFGQFFDFEFLAKY